MSNEELFFGLTQGLRKFPKESGFSISSSPGALLSRRYELQSYKTFTPLQCPDKVLCHFCFKPKKVTDEVLKPANGRKSQLLISDIIVLKAALDGIPFLSKVLNSECCLGIYIL